MKKTLIPCVVVLMAVFGLSQSTSAAEGVVASQVSSMDLNTTPLLSRTFSEMDGKSASVEGVDIGTPEPAIYFYGEKGSIFSWLHRPEWLVDSLLEPLYLSLLGAGLLVLGTLKRRENS